ncbi:toxin ParE1/3/4 [Nitrosomonas nitrosa]|uniref:Plasmid stabilization system protein ParE n=1 Tax=Nitrosomonas nitrosa TaxID=52442 RepID=A0A1I4TEK6_9PROT|nr:type II toxin-antitoxin system RelE/ParE family toxin [Nitrosomonas nitrosa]PTQ92171.1 toxin ParE1/3/4 [Nitrosomonas nitrosa]CAE6490948.1 Plasmid stabilization system protein ParE [Nitrosomonas nitrosa]SFM75132.1 toxin ParE1/3/4 [Nitrosomonas nitrosa]
MKNYEVYLTPDAIKDLTDIYEYITEKSELPEVAWAYLEKLRQKCHGLRTTPLIGQQRNDLRKNLRIIAIDKNAVVAFEINEDKQIVTILNIFYGGRDYETIMGSETPRKDDELDT